VDNKGNGTAMSGDIFFLKVRYASIRVCCLFFGYDVRNVKVENLLKGTRV